MRRKERVRLIDDAGFAVRRQKVFEPKPRGWLRSEKHLAYVRTLRSIISGSEEDIEACHIRTGTDGGTGIKPSDYFTVPMTRREHKIQHVRGERAHFATHGVTDPIARALEIAMASPCQRTREAAHEEHKRRYG